MAPDHDSRKPPRGADRRPDPDPLRAGRPAATRIPRARRRVQWRTDPCALLLAAALAAAAGGSATVAAAATSPAQASPVYSGLVVFGDSLSDTGNAGRYSNGPVWVEVIAQRLGTPLRPSRAGGSNYAVGGALTHGRPVDLRGQVARHLADRGGQADPSALHIVFAGANDLLTGGCVRGRDTAARTAAAALAASVADLADAGARHVLVPNLPDIGYAPVVRLQGPACVAEAGRLTRVFNEALEERLRQVDARQKLTVRRLDVHELTERLMADPQEAGFRDVETPCLGTRCDGLLFWDHLHPTTAAHETLADAALETLRAADAR
jgi:outer membrane lipase/esterase